MTSQRSPKVTARGQESKSLSILTGVPSGVPVPSTRTAWTVRICAVSWRMLVTRNVPESPATSGWWPFMTSAGGVACVGGRPEVGTRRANVCRVAFEVPPASQTTR
jgi:hypothetical protein